MFIYDLHPGVDAVKCRASLVNRHGGRRLPSSRLDDRMQCRLHIPSVAPALVVSCQVQDVHSGMSLYHVKCDRLS